MPRPTDRDRVGRDQRAVDQSTRDYREWEELYACDLTEQYYYGQQWQNDETELAQRKYVINLFYASVNISKPSLLFQLPKFKVTPQLTRLDDPLSDVTARAKLQEDTLNTFVQKKEIGFDFEAQLALLDSQFRFGVVQVGYTADFIDNPNQGKPILTSSIDDGTGEPRPMQDAEGNPVVDTREKAIKAERLFVKWIPAKQFRVSVSNSNRSSSCDWVGYYEWHYAEDLKKNPRYKNTADLQATGRVKLSKDQAQNAKDDERKPGMVKVWFLWDLRSRNRKVFADGGKSYLLEEPFKFLPLAFLKFHEILGQFLPLPPSFNWVHPQNQLNDMREMRRVHRRRAVRRYLERDGALDPEEKDKLVEGDDMTIAKVHGDPLTAMVPMQDAPLDPAVFRDEATMLEDFTRISGISGESQQVAQSETATQANLIALMGQTRENAKRIEVGKWLSEIGRLMLLTLREHMALPFWVKIAVDPDSPLGVVEAQEVQKLWKQITSEGLGAIENDISVDIASMSPVSQEQERGNWMQFLTLITNPVLGAVLSGSPALMRKTATLFGITSERDLVEVSKALEKAAMMAAMAQAQKQGLALPQTPAPGPTPTNGEIGGQLANQLPVQVQ